MRDEKLNSCTPFVDSQPTTFTKQGHYFVGGTSQIEQYLVGIMITNNLYSHIVDWETFAGGLVKCEARMGNGIKIRIEISFGGYKETILIANLT